MNKTDDALKILDSMIGNDAELQEMVIESQENAEVAQLIYDARTAAGLTQKQLADLVNTHQSVIARLEDADYEGHSLSMFRRIAIALHKKVVIQLVDEEKVRQL